MRVTKLYVRFFKSFNLDYERKAESDPRIPEWERIGDSWYPFIRIPLDREVTAVVGANESGKSHLIDAIKRALTGEGIDRGEFCRYSPLYSVENEGVRVPDFGLEVEAEGDEDSELLRGLGAVAKDGQRAIFLRLSDGGPQLLDADEELHELDETGLEALQQTLPLPFELETDVPLPDSISFDALLRRENTVLSDRRLRHELLAIMGGLEERSAEVLAGKSEQIVGVLERDFGKQPSAKKLASIELARKLLFRVARIGKFAFEDLERAILEGREGSAGGLVEQMNRSLARYLNFSRWWRQDRDFQLRLDTRERELVFTIRDRTGTEYSFDERSRGLRYFLSYYIQLRAHERSAERREILLMDEPDAFLSGDGQQDLLRALEAFARPEGQALRHQVVYVTHSPFLINKNAAHRIRVLDKGSNEEGTRVVNDVAKNHYEPLRSSIGSFVAETAFISGTNLLVEGPADQVLLTGVTSLLREHGRAASQLLDLNEVTVVPAGGADSIPYMAFLARGRDVLKPACVALLDGDKQGRDAEKKLKRSSDGRDKPIIDDKFILNLADWVANAHPKVHSDVHVVELEDLIPAPIAVAAARAYARRLLGISEQKAAKLEPDAVLQALDSSKNRIWDALERAFKKAFPGSHIDKVGFAKEVIDYLDRERTSKSEPAGLTALEHNFGALIATLAAHLRDAAAEESERRTNKRTRRIVRGFLRDHPESASRDEASQLLRDIAAKLEGGIGDETIEIELIALRRDFDLDQDPLERVPIFPAFKDRILALEVQRRVGYREAAEETSSALAPAG